MKSKFAILMLVLAVVTIMVVQSEAQELIWTRCLSGENHLTNTTVTGVASWYGTVGGGIAPGRYPWLANWTYVSVTSMPNNVGNVTVYRYNNGIVVCQDLFGPGGGFSEYGLCDSIGIYKTIAADTITYKMCR